MPHSIIQILEIFQSNIVFVAWLADLLAKSLLLVFIIKSLEERNVFSISSNYKYNLWFMLTLIMGLLPFSFVLTEPVLQVLLPDSNLSLITILVSTSAATSAEVAASDSRLWLQLLFGLYIAGLLFHLLKLASSFVSLSRIKTTTRYLKHGEVADLLKKLCLDLGISRQVSIGVNSKVKSPMTFGFANPIIVLPDECSGWDISLLENVMLHELCHIKRRDWLSFIGVYLIAAFNWFNPFVWYGVTRLRLEAEFSCDNLVLNCGESPKTFASQILLIARAALKTRNGAFLVQSITENSDLTLRIENILNQPRVGNSGRLPISIALLSILVLMFMFSSAGAIFAVGDEKDYPSEKLRLVYSEIPVYPDAAFENGVQGVVQYSFEVDEFGKVLPESIQLKQSNPARLFEESSLQALRNFQFKPTKVRGKTIATSDVLYTFNYSLGF